MGILLLLLHIAVCFVLVMVVLLQSGKAADLAGAFGGGGSQTALGSRGAATVLTKATTTCAVLFMITSLGLALLGSKPDVSVLESLPGETTAPAGQTPGDGGGTAPVLPPDDAAALLDGDAGSIDGDSGSAGGGPGPADDAAGATADGSGSSKAPPGEPDQQQ